MSNDPSLEDESFDISEIEGTGEGQPIFRFDGERFADDAEVKVKKYDFTNPIVLTESSFARSSTSLSTMYRRICTVISLSR
jgi:hypothetical protein